MKRKIRRLSLERETLRNLTPEHLDQVAGGTNTTNTDYGTTRHNSCNFAETHPASVCQSCLIVVCTGD